MTDKILKLCKRLKKCSLDELMQISELPKKEITSIIYLLEQQCAIQIQNGTITVCSNYGIKRKIEDKNLNSMFKFHTPENIEIIIKGFCLQIPPTKLCELVNSSSGCICDFYAIIRKMLFNRQFKKLLELFSEKPQIGRYRIFYNNYAYFYVYNNYIYVSHRLLHGLSEKDYTKAEIKEFKKVYCYLSRLESHHMYEQYMYDRLAEYIWRKEKTFDELYLDLKNNLIS